MDRAQVIFILEALVSGCSPLTGELLPDDHLIRNPEIAEAIQMALGLLGEKGATMDAALLDDDVLTAARELFRTVEKSATPKMLSAFLTASRLFKEKRLTNHPLYGVYKAHFRPGQLADLLAELPDGQNEKERIPINPFWLQPVFNNLEDKAIAQMKAKLDEIPIANQGEVPDYLRERRELHPRAMEPWQAEEARILTVALKYTNDLKFLSEHFKRSPSAIKAQANRILDQL